MIDNYDAMYDDDNAAELSSSSSSEIFADTEPLNERYARIQTQHGLTIKNHKPEQRCRSPTPSRDCVPLDSPRVWRGEETCQICRKSDNEACMLLCDDCDRGFHTSCLTPALPAIPRGGWWCPQCVGERAWVQGARCAAEDDETPRQVANRLNMDVAVLVSLNKDRYRGFTSCAKLKKGTLLAIPKDIKNTVEREEQLTAEQHQQESEKSQKMQKQLERETKKRERARQEIDDLKSQLETEKCRRIAAEEQLHANKQKQNAHVAVDSLGNSCRKECIICFEHEANQVLFPCGHSFTCEKCTQRLQSCPTCRRKVVRTCQLFL